jgi:hypothetical protein
MRGRRAADGNGSPAAAADEWPTSVRTEIMSRVTDYQFWISQTVSYFHPLGVYQHLLQPVRYFHGYNDPTAFHVPVLWDNRERPLFKSVEKFRFADSRTFDFRGEPERTLNDKRRTLADSNERGGKGLCIRPRLPGTGRPIQTGLVFREAFHPGSARQRTSLFVRATLPADYARAQRISGWPHFGSRSNDGGLAAA